jgi:hypothetical protein
MESAEDKNCLTKMLIIFFTPFKPRCRTGGLASDPRGMAAWEQNQDRVNVRPLESPGSFSSLDLYLGQNTTWPFVQRK